MPNSTILNPSGNSYTITNTQGVKRVYPLQNTIAELNSIGTSLYLLYNNKIVAGCSSVTTDKFFGDSLFGSTMPNISFGIAVDNIGTITIVGGGSGGAGSGFGTSRLFDGISFYDARQIRPLTSADNITVASSGLPTGAATATNQTNINTTLTSINTSLAPLATATNQTNTNTSLVAIVTKLTSQATAVLQSSIIDRLAAVEAKLQSGYRSNPTIRRAANITSYAVNDVYGASFELINIGSAGGFIILSGVRITFNIATLPVGMGGFLLYLYTATPPSAFTDNGAFNVSDGDRGTLITPIGIDLGTAVLAVGGGSVVLNAPNINEQFKLATGSTSLFGYLVTRGAFTPAVNSETSSLVALSLGV